MKNLQDRLWYKKLSPIQIQLYRTLYKKSAYEFCKEFWDETDPSDFIDGFVPKFLCELFQFMARPWLEYTAPKLKGDLPSGDLENIDIVDVRESNKHNINISIPPRHSKSQVLNVLCSVWLFVNEPIKVASISHNQNLATKMNQKRQQLINSEKFRFFFPEIALVQNTASSLIDSRGGEMYSINRDSATGFGYDLGLMDDLVSAETARKDKNEMSNAWSFYQNTMPSRVNSLSKYAILNIAQRLSPSDICGRIMESAELSSQYIFITLPAIFQKETYIVCPISGDVYHFEKNEPLWFERFGNYESLRLQTGESVFNTQYLQNPSSSDSAIVKEDMIREMDCTEVPCWDIANNCPDLSKVDIIYASHDFPVKDKITNDFLGSTFAYRVKKTLYVFESIQEKQNFTDSLNYVNKIENDYPGCLQIIEDKANGSPLLTMLQNEVAGLIPFQPGTQSKEERLTYASAFLQSGSVVFVRTKLDTINNRYVLSEGMQSLRKQLLGFPFLTHDDQLDSLSMLVIFVFIDVKYSVYGKSFNDLNLFDEIPSYDYDTIFFNKDGDMWKCLDIGIAYGSTNKLIILKEMSFKSDIQNGFAHLKAFGEGKGVFIDCSVNDGLNGIYSDDVIIERYTADNFDKSVTDLNYAFSKNQVLINKYCKGTQSDIENFKFSKNDKNLVKYASDRDGFVGCIRSAIKYYGGL